MSNKILVISDLSNDIIKVLELNGISFDMIVPDEVHRTNLDAYKSIMVLGGNHKGPMQIFPKDRNFLDAQIKKGKKVFSEYCESLHTVSFLESVSTRFERPVVFTEFPEADLSVGEILDEQSNDRLTLYKTAAKGLPVLRYIDNPVGFYKTEIDFKKESSYSKNALWFEQDNYLVCSFRLCNFIKARFSPRAKWCSLIGYILSWVTGEQVDMNVTRDLYDKSYRFDDNTEPFEEKCKEAVDRAFAWFENNDMYDKRYGVYNSVKEGFGTAVYADGTHKKEETVRTDNAGEMASAWLMRYLMTSDPKCLEISDTLTEFLLDLQVKDQGPFYGMMRNGPFAWWNVCYQDDSARGFLLPKLFEIFYTGRTDYVKEVKDCLDFLVRTTGKDGLRVQRTDYVATDRNDVYARAYRTYEEDGILRYATDGEWIPDVTKLPEKDGNTPSGHYNGWYLASLFLGYKLFKDEKYLNTAKKGMDKIKSVYPYTSREHSQTQELCRLILPCAMQYFATGDEADKAFLYRVTEDLQQVRHPSGAYLEWDTGYTALRGGTKGTECSVLCRNGDPVTDMLYSLNWLPVGFIQSYFVTGDEYFMDLWKDIVKFLISIQLWSDDKTIDGAWARAFDVNLKEVYGVPNDIGWAPWSIESGWTIGEIIIGMQQGLMARKLKERYKID